jgi:hypothetical protein
LPVLRTRIRGIDSSEKAREDMRGRNVVLTLLLILAPLVAAGQTGITVEFPCPGTHPPECGLSQVNAGQDVLVGVFVGEGVGGTVSVSSSDSLAELPPGPLIIDPSAQGTDFHVVFHSLGTQSITVTDLSGRLDAGTGSIVVVAPAAAVPIPDLSDSLRLVFAALIAVAGIWMLRARLP